MEQKLYFLKYGWATKYYWFNVSKYSLYENDTDIRLLRDRKVTYVDFVKEGKIVFSKYRGTTPADMHGSSIALALVSQNLIDILNNNHFKRFVAIPIKHDETLKLPSKYYFIEILRKLKKLNMDEFSIRKFIHQNNISKENILNPYENTYADLSEWDGSDIFTIEDTLHIIITEKVKQTLEKAKLTNLQIKEVPKLK